MHYQTVLNFWFKECSEIDWWKKDVDFDALIARRFSSLHQRAIQGELCHWRNSPQGRLAEVIVLDQFSRNLFRNKAKAFAFDGIALALAQAAVQAKEDQRLTKQQRAFLYMPYMHSESLQVHEQAVALFTELGVADNLDFELKHKVIIERFGRYPHRNAVLGRDSSGDELAFLTQPGSAF